MKLVYTGTPAQKDEIGMLIRAVDSADPSGALVTLTIAGPSEAEVLHLSGLERLPGSVLCLGQIPETEVRAVLASAGLLSNPAAGEALVERGVPRQSRGEPGNGDTRDRQPDRRYRPVPGRR